MSIRRTIALAGTAALVAAWATPVAAVGGTPACGSVITESVVFDGDLDCSSSSGAYAIEVGADDLYIDLNGYRILGTDGYDTSIYIEYRTGITVMNGYVEGGIYEAIDIRSSGTILVRNVSIEGEGETSDGIEVDDSAHVVLDRVDVRGAADDGVDSDVTATLIIQDSHLWENGDEGIDIDDAGTVAMTRVRAHDNGWDSPTGSGVALEDTARATLNEVRAWDNSFDGLYAEDLGALVVNRSAFNDNGNDGIYIESPDWFQISWTKANGNDEDGLDVEDNYAGRATDYVVTNSDLRYNDDDNLEVDEPVKTVRVLGL